jgi:hypoxanthine phosphoribosyltransferase
MDMDFRIGSIMTNDINQRLKDKTIQIVSLNQKIEALQAQLGGSQRRANELGSQTEQLEAALIQKDSEIQLLRDELSNTRGALETVGKEVQEIKAEQTQQLIMKKPVDQNSMREENAQAELHVKQLKENLKRFSQVANSVLNKDDGADEMLRQVLLEVGDPKYRILNMVRNRMSVGIDEIASYLVISVSEALDIVDKLQVAGEIELTNGKTVIPAMKYREIKVPTNQWMQMDPDDVFVGLEEFIGKTDEPISIVKALETAVEILEQKLTRGGAMVFQMRKTADSWKKQAGNREELQYTIREWRGRAQAML